MNSKLLVLILFAVWSGISWRWYVCTIKEACAGNNESVGTGIVEAPPTQSDTMIVSDAIQPGVSTPSSTAESTSSINEVQMEELEDRMVIHFPYSSTRKEDNDAIDAYLTRLARHLVATGGSVSISGHTDFVSDSKTNYQYGLRRAYGIRDILIKKGVNKSQVKCRSYGEGKPVATNDTALGRYKNRRVEIRISK
ncbi:MAG: OmpA family protein [Lewinellaceae bacterium]|jgi:outer membrane protein OmpA-like peptidoglycan-associated protein|nr:OmpA family protein [Lewinellaceae bacterium]